jgi:hypothetical protein
MKKLILTSLTIILSGCGAEELFNEPATDMQSCIVGSWNNEGQLPDFTYAESYQFFADGTMQQIKRTEFSYTLAALNWLGGGENIPRYSIFLRTGAWEYRDGMLHIAEQHGREESGQNEAEIIDYLVENTPVGVPMENSPSWTEYYGTTTHCDETFLKRGVYKISGEAPLIYQKQYTYRSPNIENYPVYDSTYTFFSDGTGEYMNGASSNSTTTPPQILALEYSYEGSVMDITTQACETCEPNTYQFVDHGHTLSRSKLESALFVRQN